MSATSGGLRTTMVLGGAALGLALWCCGGTNSGGIGGGGPTSGSSSGGVGSSSGSSSGATGSGSGSSSGGNSSSSGGGSGGSSGGGSGGSSGGGSGGGSGGSSGGGSGGSSGGGSGGSSGGSSGGGSGGSSGGSSGSSSGSVGSGPVIQSLTANPMTVTPSAPATVSAIVTDPAGIGDLAGGTLLDQATGQTYGAFGTPGGQGTFTLSLTWAEANAVTAVNAPAGGTTPRVFVAKFFDNQGNSTTQTITLGLGCDAGSGDTACSGTCTDTQTDLGNCGTCGNVCASSVPTSIQNGQYTIAACSGGVCEATQAFTTDTSCDSACATLPAGSCATSGACGPDFFVQYADGNDYFGDCPSVPAASDPNPPDSGAPSPFYGMICCCVSQ